MTTLTIHHDRPPFAATETVDDLAAIAARLAPLKVGLERWDADRPLDAGASDADVLDAYAPQIAALKQRGGYGSVDVVRLVPDHPQRDELRAKFLAEHVHDDDEVRFFVEGAGMFYLRGEDAVFALECTAGDLIVLPAGTRHWFDTGAQPRFTAIRLFSRPDGWVARFTGDRIAESLPLYDGAR